MRTAQSADSSKACRKPGVFIQIYIISTSSLQNLVHFLLQLFFTVLIDKALKPNKVKRQINQLSFNHVVCKPDWQRSYITGVGPRWRNSTPTVSFEEIPFFFSLRFHVVNYFQFGRTTQQVPKFD